MGGGDLFLPHLCSDTVTEICEEVTGKSSSSLSLSTCQPEQFKELEPTVHCNDRRSHTLLKAIRLRLEFEIVVLCFAGKTEFRDEGSSQKKGL